MKTLARTHATWGKITAAIAVFLVLAGLMKSGERRFEALTGDLGVPDLAVGVADLGAYLDSIDKNRVILDTYLFGISIPDVFFPLSIGVFLVLLSARANLSERLFWIPVAAVLCDYAENLGILLVLYTDPGPSGLGKITSALTHVKFALYAGAVVNVLFHIDRVLARKPG